MTPADADAAVRRGAAVLDERGPAGWRDTVRAAIEAKNFDMLDPCGCVLGHAYAEADADTGFWAGLDALAPPKESRRAWSDAHGFSAGLHFSAAEPQAWDQLAAAWARLLGAEVPA